MVTPGNVAYGASHRVSRFGAWAARRESAGLCDTGSYAEPVPVPLGFLWVAWMSASAQLTLLAADPSDLLAGVALTALVLLNALLAARVPGGSGAPGFARVWAGLRARSRGRRTPRQIDPDAAGRPRPRAPGHPLAA